MASAMPHRPQTICHSGRNRIIRCENAINRHCHRVYNSCAMSIPDFQQVMLPLLKQLSDRQGHSLRDLIESVAEEFKLTDSERRELLPSGSQFIFNNRVGWARTYMKKAGLILT